MESVNLEPLWQKLLHNTYPSNAGQDIRTFLRELGLATPETTPDSCMDALQSCLEWMMNHGTSDLAHCTLADYLSELYGATLRGSD